VWSAATPFAVAFALVLPSESKFLWSVATPFAVAFTCGAKIYFAYIAKNRSKKSGLFKG